MPPGFGNELRDGTGARGQGFVDDLRGFRGTGKSHAGNIGAGREWRAHLGAVAGNYLQNAFGHAGGVKQFGGFMGNERRLFGWFGDNGVASHQRSGNLAGINGQRKVPRADADKHAAALVVEVIAFAGGARHFLTGRQVFFGLLCVITAEIHCFADFGNAIGHVFAGLLLCQVHQLAAIFFQQVGHFSQGLRALLHGGVAPVGKGLHGILQGFFHHGRIAVKALANHGGPICRTGDVPGCQMADVGTGHQRPGFKTAVVVLVDFGVQLFDFGQRTQIDTT